jgi:hypothetical protein
MGRPHIFCSLSLPGRALSSRASAAVLVSVHTIALYRGSPDLMSQTTVVSLWLVMPMALMLSLE